MFPAFSTTECKLYLLPMMLGREEEGSSLATCLAMSMVLIHLTTVVGDGWYDSMLLTS